MLSCTKASDCSSLDYERYRTTLKEHQFVTSHVNFDLSRSVRSWQFRLGNRTLNCMPVIYDSPR